MLSIHGKKLTQNHSMIVDPKLHALSMLQCTEKSATESKMIIVLSLTSL